jgi:hypothetical protein
MSRQKRALTSEEIDRAVKTGVIPGYADQFSRDAIRNQRSAIAAGRNGFPAAATAPTFNPALELERKQNVTPAGASADSLRASLGLPAKQKNKSSRATGSKTNTPEPIDYSKGPKPSDERQPQLEDDPANRVRQGSRFTRDGENRSQSFNINGFRSEILENDVLPTHSYLVTFSPFRAGFKENEPLTAFVTSKRDTLVLRCENVVLPSPALLEEENIRRYGYGPVEKVPYGVQFSDVTMTWLVDNESEIVNFFNQWMNTIVLHNSPNTLMNATAVRPSDRGLVLGLDDYDPFELGYKDAYTNPIVRIYVYNRQNQTTTTYEMYDVFPLNIQAMNLSWADENETQKLTITFAYTNMKVSAPIATGLRGVQLLNEGSIPFQLPSLMEKIPLPDVRLGVTDSVRSPASESITTTVNASQPNATEAPQPRLTSPIPTDIPGIPVTREF